MSTRNWTLGGFGLGVAVLAALSVTACDPYQAANTSAPVVLGVTMVDVNYNEIVPPDSAGCVAPYPQVDKTWADKAFPGLCNPANVDFGIPTVCPVQCYPPRMGPAYAPLYIGNLGGTYQTTLPGQLSSYTYQLPAAYVLSGVPIFWQPDGSDDTFQFVYAQIRVLFNKMMDPKSIQPDPLLPVAAPGLRVFADAVDVTADFAVEYVPNSDTEYWGASLIATPASGLLDPGVVYRVAGDVKDQQGNTLTVDVRVATVAAVIGPVP
jgi:hypothetical protein